MFDSAELGQSLDKASFKAREPELREALLEAQFDLRDAGFSVVVVIAGMEGSGKGELLHRLLEWLDARGVAAHAMRAPSDEERERPALWRFWRRLPRRGRIGVFLGSWYADLFLSEGSESKLESPLRRIVEFEDLLADDGTLVLKFWLHVTKKNQRKRFEKRAEDPHDAWRVTKRDWDLHERYDELIERATHVLRRTDTGTAPWEIVEASNARFRDVTVAERLLAALEERLARPAPEPPAAPELPVPPAVNLLSSLDLEKRLDEDEYEQGLDRYQGRLGLLVRELAETKRSLVLVFEGPDAAGKGGAIRRVTRALDARFYRVVPIGAPTEEERAHPYLWRFWRHLPRYGEVRVFDRSWYGRVLVERIEGFATPEEHRRAYGEINAFEEALADDGVVIVKFWLAIDEAEQLRRFEARERTGYKRHKITADDWRNREKWAAYEAAACEMFERTSTRAAPWTLVAANDKRHARVEVLRTVCERLEELRGPTDEGKKRKKR